MAKSNRQQEARARGLLEEQIAYRAEASKEAYAEERHDRQEDWVDRTATSVDS